MHLFETPQDKEDVVAAKKRTRFKLSMLNIKPGTELALARDLSIKCTTLDDVNQVQFKGQQTSLSDAASQAYISLGFAPAAISGPWAWTMDGKRLDDMRRELDEMLS